MEDYIRQLRATYNSKLYYFTLFGTLSLIDCCAALNSPSGETSGRLFKDWFNKYLPQYSSTCFGSATSFSANECYQFRCRMLHQLRAEIDADSMDRTVKSGKIAFAIGGSRIHMCNFGGVYYLDIQTFMEDVISGVERWTDDVRNVPHVEENRHKMVKVRNYDPGHGIGGKGQYIS
jgi:hypothetical protein